MEEYLKGELGKMKGSSFRFSLKTLAVKFYGEGEEEIHAAFYERRGKKGKLVGTTFYNAFHRHTLDALDALVQQDFVVKVPPKGAQHPVYEVQGKGWEDIPELP